MIFANALLQVTDDQSWRAGEAATLFNGDFTPKEAYTSLVQLLQ